MRCCITTTISNAFVLGAGLGTRLKPFTSLMPKPLIPVMGMPCIEFSLLQLQSHGVKKVIINTHAHAAQMRNYITKQPAVLNELQLIESNEEAQLLGSGGGYVQAYTLMQQQGCATPLIAMNGDVITNIDLAALEARHLQLRKSHGVSMTLAVSSGALQRETMQAYRELKLNPANGLVLGLGEMKSQPTFFLGVGIYEPEVFMSLAKQVPLDFVSSILDPAMSSGRCGFYEHDGFFIDVGSPDLWWRAHQRIQQMSKQQHPALPLAWTKQFRTTSVMDQPWSGWVKYGNVPAPEQCLGKPGIQMDNLFYEISL